MIGISKMQPWVFDLAKRNTGVPALMVQPSTDCLSSDSYKNHDDLKLNFICV